VPHALLSAGVVMQIVHTSYPMLLGAVRRVFGAHAAVLFMPDETGRYAAIAADCPDNTVKTGVAAEPGKGLVGWILRNRQPLIVNNFDRRSRLGYYGSSDAGRITAFMGCPLDSGGVLCVDDIQPRAFSEEHTESLRALGSLFALPAPMSADAEDVRRYFARLERLQELRVQHAQWKTYLPAFLKLTAEATRFDHVAFAVIQSETNEFYIVEAESAPLLLADGASPRLPIAGGVVGWVFRNDVPVHTEGLGSTPAAALYGKLKGVPDFRSVVCLPVTVNRVTSAALCLGGLEPRPIPQAMRSFIRMAADELVQFLETLYLRHRVRSLTHRGKAHASQQREEK